jgi:type VI protein secretion system component Hcp
MIRRLSARSTAVGAALLLAAAMGGTLALNSGVAVGATRPRVIAGAKTTTTIFLSAPDIKGPVGLSYAKGSMQLTSLSANFDRTAGAFTAGPVMIDKYVDTATPQLLTAAAQGTSLNGVVISVFQQLGGLLKWRTKYELTGVVVVHDGITETAGSQVEHLELTYQSVKMTQNPLPGGGYPTVFTYAPPQ